MAISLLEVNPERTVQVLFKFSDLFDSSNAVDGLKSDLSAWGRQCVVSKDYYRTATWWVNLTAIHSIHYIRIYYRTDNVVWNASNDYTERFLGFYVYVSNTTDRLNGQLCFHDADYNKSMIPAVVNITCPVHGQYVIYYNERLSNVTYSVGYSTDAHSELCEVEVFGCKSGFYGPNCSQPCPKDCRYCEIETGVCTWCKPGYQGYQCYNECSGGKYGQDCGENCGACLGYEQCNYGSGSCTEGCDIGYEGTLCRTECSLGRFGTNCERFCSKNLGYLMYATERPENVRKDVNRAGLDFNVLKSVMEVNMDRIVDRVVEPALIIKNVITSMVLVRKAVPRDSKENSVKQCNRGTGECEGGCQPGWEGPQCESACTENKYGTNCSYTCGFCQDSSCHHVDGSCAGTCVEGYQGALCNEVYKKGFYGDDCTEECSPFCKSSRDCHHVTGHCNEGYELNIFH
ncbi:multiple epidermal growth factor-like domains protein 11 [Saccostrea cucullata]|uniref:multiple epidermal growth factor-like domains protein 11 n=1 Tax=Saccostrea cuccullata TaxID=36930 RepID=UPI002ED1E8B6